MKKIASYIGFLIIIVISISCSRPHYSHHVITLKVSESDYGESFNNLYSHVKKEAELNDTKFITSLKQQLSLTDRDITDKLMVSVKKGKLLDKKNNAMEYYISILIRYKCENKSCSKGNKVIKYCKNYFNNEIQNY